MSRRGSPVTARCGIGGFLAVCSRSTCSAVTRKMRLCQAGRIAPLGPRCAPVGRTYQNDNGIMEQHASAHERLVQGESD